MKIIHLSWDFPTNEDKSVVGGMVKNPWTLALALRTRGHEVSVATTSRVNAEYRGKYGAGIDAVTYVENPRAISGIFRNIWRMVKISRALRGLDAEVLHAHMPSLYPILGLGNRGMRRVITAHGSHWPEMRANFTFSDPKSMLILANGYIQFLLERMVYARADKVISVSRFQIKEMRELYKLPAEKIVHIPNGIDRSRFTETVPERERGEAYRSDILFVGRPVPKKGVDTMVRLANDLRFKEQRFTLVFGRGWVSEPDISGSVESAHGNIRVVYDAPETELAAYYRNSTVTLVPSRGYESLPTVIMESLFCGTPVIASRNFGNIELLPAEMMAQEDDYEEWTRKLEAVLRAPKAAAMAGLNRALLEEYDIVNVVEKHLDAYRCA
jgi:glycosyltransferase involved in cell wall biosynthesis